MTSSLIISTYNWHQALELVLASVLKQTILPDEIIIADDGSTHETRNLIKKYSLRLKIPIKHIWQEDKGFRKSEILNKSFIKAKGDYIIQIDGDIIIHTKFIEDHLKNAKTNTFFYFFRSFLDHTLSQKSISKKTTTFYFYQKGLTNRWNSIYFPLISRLFKSSKSLKKTRGCNFSCFKKDFLLTNGYNEDMTGWGKEDTELSARLINNNILKKHLKFCAISYHLHHKILGRKGLNKNIEILRKTIETESKKCKNGVNKYLI